MSRPGPLLLIAASIGIAVSWIQSLFTRKKPARQVQPGDDAPAERRQ